MNQPGQILEAKVNGRRAKIYLTLSHLDVDGKPRWRYAPGSKKAHDIIPKEDSVEVVRVYDRLKKRKKS